MAGTMTEAEKILDKIRVRIYKKEPYDDRDSLCGEPLQRDASGKPFFEIPASQVDYILAVHTNLTKIPGGTRDDKPQIPQEKKKIDLPSVDDEAWAGEPKGKASAR